MTPEEYAAAQAGIAAAVADFVMKLAKLFVQPALGIAEWLTFLELIYPEVQRQREASAEIGRQFYDSQRELHHPDVPRNDTFLVEYPYQRFVQDMDPTRQRLSQEDAPPNAIGEVALRAVRNVENGGRQQIIRAVQTDQQPEVIRGWARVATGRETCAWCLMLISRGPIFYAADRAGLNLSDDTAARMIAAGEDVTEHMDEWHDGCDCKVVPVFKPANWFGKGAADRALELWNEATREAIKRIDSGEARSDNGNREAINALRRRFDRGEIDPSEFAAIAA